MVATFLIGAAALSGGVLLAPVPPGVVPRNEVERLVLARPESASRELEALLAEQQDGSRRELALTDAGFRHIRPGDACANYVYSRKLNETLVRGASVILCDGKPPFVLRTDETLGPWATPEPGRPSVVTPPTPR